LGSDSYINPPILKVAQLGHPILRRLAEPLTEEEIADPQTQVFIDSMIRSMPEHNAAGFAAPQMHLSKKIIVIEAQNNERYPDKPDIPRTILINPAIKTFSDELEEDWEGCISLKDLWGKVRRSKSITVDALDRAGKEVTIEAEGFFARVLQHEIDHLYGKLFIDRMDDLSTLCFTTEYHRYLVVPDKVDYPCK